MSSRYRRSVRGVTELGAGSAGLPGLQVVCSAGLGSRRCAPRHRYRGCRHVGRTSLQTGLTSKEVTNLGARLYVAGSTLRNWRAAGAEEDIPRVASPDRSSGWAYSVHHGVRPIWL